MVTHSTMKIPHRAMCNHFSLQLRPIQIKHVSDQQIIPLTTIDSPQAYGHGQVEIFLARLVRKVLHLKQWSEEAE